MGHQILINMTPQETRVAFIEQGITQELHIERSATRGLVGNIYLGRVCRVLPGMESAFVEIGLERAAFLHIADIWRPRHDGTPQETVSIQQLLGEGQALLVQVIKDPIGSKGARLSTQISIAGRYLVYLPQDTHIGVSQKIEAESDREQLRERLQLVLQNILGQNQEVKGGFIIRTIAENATETELRADVEYLCKIWHDICENAKTARVQTMLYQELDLPLRVLRDFVNDDTESIYVDSRETFLRMRQFATDYMRLIPQEMQHYSGERPLFDLFGVEQEIEKALARRVDLKSGGYLILEQTEALTTIDVNTGGYVGGRSFDDTVFKTNLEAAQAIARQLRLRNLGGIIIVDFIDMDNPEHRDAVLDELKRALARDRTKISVNGFTALGLVEMTRKRTRESLAHTLCEPCPLCQGRGEIKTAQTVCYTILREILRESRLFNAKEFKILASHTVIDLFLGEEAHSLAQLADFIAKPISLQTQSDYSQEQFDIILI